MVARDKIVKIFIGADRSQLLAFKVLEHSIKRTTARNVECVPIDNSMMPECKSAADLPYTNFSFARFGIPSFTGYKGRAIYLDADMLVLADISGLWDMDFGGAKMLLLEPASRELQKKQSKKRKQTAVMLLDCENLREWVPEKIINDLGSKYDRNELMSLAVFPPGDIAQLIPTTWNCMDWYEKDVSQLVHYTKIETQPWVSPLHRYGFLWLDELKLMLRSGTIDEDFIRKEVELGYIRPSLLAELGFEADKGLKFLEIDMQENFQMHKEMLARQQSAKVKSGRFGFLARFNRL